MIQMQSRGLVFLKNMHRTSLTEKPSAPSFTYAYHEKVRMEVASTRPDHLTILSIAKTSELSLLVKSPLVAERSMPAPLLRLLLQCAGDIEMNHGLVSTPTPTNCLRLMQWSANGISEKINELLTFLHSNNVNIAAIQETKLTNKTKPLKTPGWAAVRLDRHKNKGGGLLC